MRPPLRSAPARRRRRSSAALEWQHVGLELRDGVHVACKAHQPFPVVMPAAGLAGRCCAATCAEPEVMGVCSNHLRPSDRLHVNADIMTPVYEQSLARCWVGSVAEAAQPGFFCRTRTTLHNTHSTVTVASAWRHVRRTVTSLTQLASRLPTKGWPYAFRDGCGSPHPLGSNLHTNPHPRLRPYLPQQPKLSPDPNSPHRPGSSCTRTGDPGRRRWSTARSRSPAPASPPTPSA